MSQKKGAKGPADRAAEKAGRSEAMDRLIRLTQRSQCNNLILRGRIR